MPTIHAPGQAGVERADGLGVKAGDRVATLAWNTGRHMEAWYGIMGIGAVCHTLNPRLFAEQLAYIINHAEDKIIFVDLTFVPLLDAHRAALPDGQARRRHDRRGRDARRPNCPAPSATRRPGPSSSERLSTWGGFDEN